MMSDKSSKRAEYAWRAVTLLSVPAGLLVGGLFGVVVSDVASGELLELLLFTVPMLAGIILGVAVGSYAEVMADHA